MGLRDIIRSLAPGYDRQLAEDLSAQNRAGHRRSIPGVAAKAEAWEEKDRQRDRFARNKSCETDWN
ncbi:hypothetical protein K4B79_18765 [Streptomyces lincolnensis]|uniref:hypothetical protein n=1 Tax=Streptomyces lincolnensis TaxID=1915 RepID=UPI001E5167AE|nr:hypothetical protein [Streptomyces lincolnensis]MCD7440258.1 hypothetical protein [Streptomyces lincolnensis]